MIWWPADDCITCVECHGRSHDAIEEKGKKILLECNYCGLRQWATNAPSKPRDDTPRMTTGRYSGKTLAEIDASPNGRRYLEAVAKNDERLREAVSRYLAASQ